MNSLSPEFLGSTPAIRDDLFRREPHEVPIVEFFGNINHVSPTKEPLHIRRSDLSPRLGKSKKQVVNTSTPRPHADQFKAWQVRSLEGPSANTQFLASIATGIVICLLALSTIRSK